MIDISTTITAPATAQGGAISVIRLSGTRAVEICSSVFSGKLQDRTAVFGTISDGERIVDEVLATLFVGPRSYTGEDCVEISCHGSAYITSEIVRLLVAGGAVMATPGEFTLRAFLAGKLDLSQAEAVADLISSNSSSAAQVAMQQMRGGYSEELRVLAAELLDICSLLELELDFSEEDVEFADRAHLRQLIVQILSRVESLSASFRLGNAMKNGVPVAIVGKPNVGKSTLLNRLVGEQRAIVSDIAGTTRDFIEESIVIDGILFRFIDTAGLRQSTDAIEKMGIERSYEKMKNAAVVLQVIDNEEALEALDLAEGQALIVVRNKSDVGAVGQSGVNVCISAKYGDGVDSLKRQLVAAVGIENYDSGGVIVSNARHFEALKQCCQSFSRAIEAIDGLLPTDLVAAEIKMSLNHIAEITGEITTDDILGNIFSKFCIGK